MASLVFVTGDFCSGSTLLFTLFRSAGWYSLYEPLHERLPQYLYWPLREEGHHPHVGNYMSEYRGMRRLVDLHDPAWGVSRLAIEADEPADELYRYLAYAVGTAYGRAGLVMLKENRLPFRLQWLRRNFPTAAVVHIHRRPERQFASIVTRVQEHLGRQDVGQDRPDFNGFNIARWCDDLTPRFPELSIERHTHGYERFAALWKRSYAANCAGSDISVDFDHLVGDLEATLSAIGDVIGHRFEPGSLAGLIVPPASSPEPALGSMASREHAQDLVYRAGRRYADARVRLRRRWPRG